MSVVTWYVCNILNTHHKFNHMHFVRNLSLFSVCSAIPIYLPTSFLFPKRHHLWNFLTPFSNMYWLFSRPTMHLHLLAVYLYYHHWDSLSPVSLNPPASWSYTFISLGLFFFSQWSGFALVFQEMVQDGSPFSHLIYLKYLNSFITFDCYCG